MVCPSKCHRFLVELGDEAPYHSKGVIDVWMQISRNKKDRINEGMPYVLNPAFNSVALPTQRYCSM
eukprot:10374871-Lingulodinium_polyedra.AAC.1